MPSSFLQSLGERIRSSRTERGLSQEELARSAGIDRAHLGRIERGAQNMAVLTLARVSRALGREAHELLAVLPAYDPATDEPDAPVTPKGSSDARTVAARSRQK